MLKYLVQLEYKRIYKAHDLTDYESERLGLASVASSSVSLESDLGRVRLGPS